MNDAACTVSEYANEPANNKYNRNYIKKVTHNDKFLSVKKIIEGNPLLYHFMEYLKKVGLLYVWLT